MSVGNEWLITVVSVCFTHTHRSQFLAESISAELMQIPVIVYGENVQMNIYLKYAERYMCTNN